MSARLRTIVFVVGAVGVAAALVPALVQLTAVDAFADLIATYYLEVGVEQRESYNVVSSVIFDYRGFDTMFEQLILFSAVVGVSLLLRVQREEVEEREAHDSLPSRDVPSTSGALRLAGSVLVGFALLIGVYILLAVHLTPGGGFQSGVLVSAGFLAIYLADEYALYDRLTSVAVLERIEAVAAGSYLLVGLAGLVVGGALLANVIPLGEVGGAYAGGTIWVLNLIVGIEVTAGFVLVFSEFLQQAVLVRRRGRR